MTRMTRPDCAVMCNLINTHTLVGIFYFYFLLPFTGIELTSQRPLKGKYFRFEIQLHIMAGQVALYGRWPGHAMVA